MLDTSLSAEQEARAEEILAAITAAPPTRRRPRVLPWLSAAAAALVVVGIGFGALPQQQARAEAEEALEQASESSLAKSQPPRVTSADYLRRVDASGEARVVTVMRTDAGGAVDVEQHTSGELPQVLEEAARGVATQTPLDPERDIVGELREKPRSQAVREALTLLLSPGLGAQQQSELYAFIAGQSGNRVIARGSEREGEAITISRAHDGLTLTILPETGQLVSVTGLVAPEVTTTVDAAGIVGCVNVTGVAGPEEISLACADNNYVVSDLEWQGWNSESARATGTAWINECDPDCASGRMRKFPVQVRASEKRSCGYNLEVYTSLEVTYSSEVRSSEPLAANETFELGCG
ncbi:hypothetical protein C3E79_06275 [Corynebacterium liangguodongii]|uniref:Uncharacterized protein n=1 Tax=Corynebacterium liangguodongii TaxID=2079535 RepID=A0A2S0WEC4_9CORY|nr:hypothetical protein C3E79_06275 [Corynebacterium liangguodongii]PWC00144.1 hypothetical protein DF219_02915 [Corynebacterium liangguodongii]